MKYRILTKEGKPICSGVMKASQVLNVRPSQRLEVFVDGGVCFVAFRHEEASMSGKWGKGRRTKKK